MITGVGKIVISVGDQEACKAFWTSQVGFDLVRDDAYGDERWIEVAPPGGDGPVMVLSRLEPGESRPDAPAERPHWPVFFTCDDIEATYRELSSQGVEFPLPPRQLHFGWWALFADPEGTRFALGQWG